VRGQFVLDFRHMDVRPVPAGFQLARHQPVRWVGGIILPKGPVDGIARRFEIAAESVARLISPISSFPRGGGCGGDGPGTYDAEQRLLYRIIDAQSAEGDAMRATIVHPGATAAVARDMMLQAGVPERELSAAALASDQACQKRVAMLGRAVMPTGGNVAADHRTDRFEPLPAYVPVMGVGHQSKPFVAGFAADLRAHARSAVSRRRSCLTIGIGAAVDGVHNHSVDGGVVRPPPGRIVVVLLYWQIDIVLVEPAERLSRAAQFLDLVKHQLNRFLDAPIRILLIVVARLHEADRRSHDEFAPARLLVPGRKRALSQ
jgi:hypothetical protein